jgi:cysteine desulfurase/selenocysteine lyase
VSLENMLLTLDQILADETLRRREFPVAAEKIFLGHAGVCPLPRRVMDAMTDLTLVSSMSDQEEAYGPGRMLEVRRLAARLMNAQPEEVALVGPTSLALSYVAGGLPFRRGDNVLIYHDDYPSNVYPWMALAERGVQVRFLNLRELGRIRRIDVEGQIDESTRLVALASCHFLAGWRIDLAGIGRLLRKRGILFCVDGIQTLGAFPTTVEHVDFLAADAHKWLLGPLSAGIFYVRKEVQDRLRPTVFGWHNVRCPNYVAQEQIVHPPDARRYEAGSANLVGLAGLEAALRLLLEIGINPIAAELLRKRQKLVLALRAKSYEVLQESATPEHASGIVTFHRPLTDLPALHARLAEQRIITSLRGDRSGQRYIRLSPHFYNTDAELDQLLAML